MSSIAVQLVAQKRTHAVAKHGTQDHRNGTGATERACSRRLAAQRETEHARKAGTLTWALILREEFREVLASANDDELISELGDLAAVCEEWIDALARRQAARRFIPGVNHEPLHAAIGDVMQALANPPRA